MRVYKENIERWKRFLKSDYFSKLLAENRKELNWVFDALNLDPDQFDTELYKKLGEKFNLEYKKCYLIDKVGNKDIHLSADIICGYKQLLKFLNGNYEALIEKYESIRSNVNLHFIWPKHAVPTINTLRFSIYRDRIDFLLFDLKQYFSGCDTPMSKVYSSNETRNWLKQFSNFSNFIDKMKLEKFVNEDYEVYDISKKNTSIIGRNDFEDFLTGKNYSNTISDYFNSLLQLVSENYYD